MTDDILLTSQDGPITVLELNNPATINALSRAMLERLDRALAAIAASDARVVILRTAGRNFCAGHDLREMQGFRTAPDGGRAQFTDLLSLCSRVMQAIAALPQVVVAQVQGVATAGGCQLAASCDMVVAAENARFGVNGINIGLFCHTPIVALSHKIGPTHAFELAATGAFLPASEALKAGLATRLATPEALEAETRALAQILAQKLPSALASGKRAAAARLETAYAEATARMVDNLMNADTAEGIQAFLEKRSPAWA